MDCVFNTEERLRRRAASGLLLVLAVLVGWLSLADGPARAMSTTTVSAAIFTYDFPAVARVDAHELVAAEASPTQLSEVRKESASPSVQARGASTTSFRSVVATERDPESWTPVLCVILLSADAAPFGHRHTTAGAPAVDVACRTATA